LSGRGDIALDSRLTGELAQQQQRQPQPQQH
jgi:hypothetical protein